MKYTEVYSKQWLHIDKTYCFLQYVHHEYIYIYNVFYDTNIFEFEFVWSGQITTQTHLINRMASQ